MKIAKILISLVLLAGMAFGQGENFTFGLVANTLALDSFNGYQAQSFALFGGAFGCCPGPEGADNFWFQLGNHKSGGSYGAGGSFTLNTSIKTAFCPCSYTGTWQDASIDSTPNPDGTFTTRLSGHLSGTLCSDFGCFENIPATYSQSSYENKTLPATAFSFGELVATRIPPN